MNTKRVVKISTIGPLRPTRYAKRMIADAMYARGKSFLGAAILLEQKGGHEYVVLHLFCQGIEITLKALLLFVDFDKYKPQLHNKYGHKIDKLAADVSIAFALHPLKPALRDELHSLSYFFCKHLLRYAGTQDIFVSPDSIKRDRVFRRIVAVLRMVERELACEKATESI